MKKVLVIGIALIITLALAYSPARAVAVKSECLILMGSYDNAAHCIMDFYHKQKDKDSLDPALKEMLVGLKLDVSEKNLYPMDKILLHVDNMD